MANYEGDGSLLPALRPGYVTDVATHDYGSFTIPGKAVVPDALTRPTPPTKRRWLDLGGGKGYWYVEGTFVIERLNEAYNLPGEHNWWTTVAHQEVSAPDDDNRVEVLVAIRLFVPGGPVAGILGIGSDKYYPKAKADSLVNTLLAAETRALKRAARYLGIGLDVNENPNEGAQLDALRETVNGLAANLVEKGKLEEVRETFNTLAPQAIVNDELLTHLITEDQVEPLKKALVVLMRDRVKVAK